MSLLEVRDLTTGYGRQIVIENMSFSANAGEAVVVIGHNGAGKTTLLNSIVGAIPAARGSVLVDGVQVLGRGKRASGLAIVPQGMGVFPSLSVEENVKLGLSRSARLSRDEAGERVERAIRYLPLLGERWHDRAGSLSGGQRQMVSIGRALVSGATCLLLDEPSVGLSPKLVESMMEVFATLRNDGLAVVLVEQNVKQALTVADRVVVMKAGRVIVENSIEDFAARENLWELF